MSTTYEDYEISDTPCPKCGNDSTHIRDCLNWCDDGMIDDSDTWFEPEGSVLITCSECKGKGFVHWCPECGYEFENKDYEDVEDDNFPPIVPINQLNLF